MNLHGFWDNDGARKVRKTQFHGSRLTITLSAPPGRPDPYQMPRESWRDHPDQTAVARAAVALCTVPKSDSGNS